MDIQVAVLCDYAADYQGKLCVQGAFDTLFARQFPVIHPACALALRLCLTPEDSGDHKLGIRFFHTLNGVLFRHFYTIAFLSFDGNTRRCRCSTLFGKYR